MKAKCKCGYYFNVELLSHEKDGITINYIECTKCGKRTLSSVEDEETTEAQKRVDKLLIEYQSNRIEENYESYNLAVEGLRQLQPIKQERYKDIIDSFINATTP